MPEFYNNAYFWQKIDTLYYSSHMEIVRPKGTAHPQYKNLIYPLDYGYLTDTVGESGHGIAVFMGTSGVETVSTMIIAADILKKDVEIKLLVCCTPEEENAVLEFLNQTDFQKTILVRRGRDIPSWAISN
ncbi:MAG: Inorganic pyrophosphatase [Erysipelotrichaceae bacterium]|nr:Inorganic pyrophosphatase [Erysipelotrichaceae bacterium]